ncbi:MAG TPA: alpha/beta hydrolase, partial [Thermoanaerobaculia bacterium]|nr:alpha/beta hydrolase [Thermoanaerobaculia bacterium]
MRSIQTTALLAFLAVLSLPALAAEPKSGFLTMQDGAKIHYLEAGQGPAILLIPGWSMAAEIWEPQISGLSKAHRVVAFDPRSQGQSTKTTDGNFPEVRARDLGAVIDQLGLAPVTLVCWS